MAGSDPDCLTRGVPEDVCRRTAAGRPSSSSHSSLSRSFCFFQLHLPAHCGWSIKSLHQSQADSFSHPLSFAEILSKTAWTIFPRPFSRASDTVGRELSMVRSGVHQFGENNCCFSGVRDNIC